MVNIVMMSMIMVLISLYWIIIFIIVLVGLWWCINLIWMSWIVFWVLFFFFGLFFMNEVLFDGSLICSINMLEMNYFNVEGFNSLFGNNVLNYLFYSWSLLFLKIRRYSFFVGLRCGWGFSEIFNLIIFNDYFD